MRHHGTRNTLGTYEGTHLPVLPPHIMSAKALVVLSGGQDSTTCLFWAVREFGVDHVLAVTYNYGQRHARELAAAIAVAGRAGIPDTNHSIVKVGPLLGGRSPLTDHSAELEQYTNHQQMEQVIGDRVELTFVPMRNALFLVLAANHAVCRDAYHLVTGVCEADNANYPDCRASFISNMEETVNLALGLEAGLMASRLSYAAPSQFVRIHTPLIAMTKAQSIALAMELPGCYAALAYSHTAYDGWYPPNGKDHASVLRAHGFEQAGVPDPLVMRAAAENLMDLPATANYSEGAILQVAHLLEPHTIHRIAENGRGRV